MAEQGLFFCFIFVKEMVTSEKRGKDTAKEERILCLQVRGFILLFQLAVCHWHLSLSTSWAAPVAGCNLPLPFVVHQQLPVQLLMALRGFYRI